MFVTKVIILGLISFASGASVNPDGSNLQTMVTDAVRNILSERHTGENISTAAILKELDELKNKSIRLEQRINILEQENRDKDMFICSLQTNLNALVEMVSRNVGGNVNNLTENGSHDLINKCRDWKSGAFEKRNSGKETLVRTTRNAVSPHNIAFSAYLSHTMTNMHPGQVIKFDRVLLNERAVYNPYTGAFTAPISGTYLFTFHFDARIHTFVRLSVDGKNIVDAVANPHTNPQDYHDRESMSGNTVIIHVGIGQSVLVEVYDVNGEAASSDKYRLSSFSGVFLYEE